jgi:hypothetical protein
MANDSESSGKLVYQGARSIIVGITVIVSTKPAVRGTRSQGAGDQRRTQVTKLEWSSNRLEDGFSVNCALDKA